MKLRDGQRAELIDGQFHNMAPLSRIHQEISYQISRLLGNYIESNGGKCRVYPPPFAINLDADDKDWVEPDISLICDPNKLTDRGCSGAPALIFEIRSPSSRRMDYIIKNMVGREIKEKFPRVECRKGKKIFEVKNLNAGKMVRDINFSLYEGEIVGFAGLMGAGRTELMMAVFGAAKLEEGEIEIGGVPVRIQSPKDAIRQKIALVTEDRKRYGLNLTASVEDNAVSVIESSLSKFGFYRRKLGRKAAEEMISRMNTKVTGMDQIVGSLSGGNMQKVVLSKWLLNDPDIIIFDEPTRGIDVGAKAEIYKIIEELACKGKGIIIISSEMPELIGLSQRIIVLHEGEQTGELRGKEMTQENIMTLASGYRKEEKE